jgi:hypothetical protein
VRCGLQRADLGRDLLRLLLRGVEEARQDLGPILRRDHLRQLHDAGYAKATVLERLDHLRVALDQLGGHLAKVAGSLGEDELPMQEDEEAGVAEFLPEPLPVKVCEGDEEIGHRRLFPAEEVEEADSGLAGVRHALIVARDFGPSWNARNRRRERNRAGGLLPPRRHSRRVPDARRRPCWHRYQ